MWFSHWSFSSATPFSSALRGSSIYCQKNLSFPSPMVLSSSMFSTQRFIIVQPSGAMTQSAKLKPPSMARSSKARLVSHRKLVI